MSSKIEKKIEAFETLCWRMTLRISWAELISNEDVYQKIQERRSIWTSIREGKKIWIGYLLRKNARVTSILEGKLGEGRSRLSCMKHIELLVRSR